MTSTHSLHEVVNQSKVMVACFICGLPETKMMQEEAYKTMV